MSEPGIDATTQAPEEAALLSPQAAALSAWLAAGLLNALLIGIAFPPPGSVGVRLAHHAFDLGQFAALGLFASAATDLWMRIGVRRRPITAAALALFGGAVGALTLPRDLEGFIGRYEDRAPAWLLLVLCIGFFAASVAGAWLVGRWLARPFIRWAAVLVGLAAMAINGFILPLDYPGGHLFLALAGTTFAGAAVALLRLPDRLSGVARRWRARRKLRWGLLALASAAAASAVVLAPPPVVAPELLRFSGSVLPPFLGRLRSSGAAREARVDPSEEEWFAPREELLPILPGPQRIIPADGMVVFFSIDAVRADLLGNGKTASQLPALARFRQSAIDFESTRAPGTQTVYTLATIFAGTYFSQQYWTKAPFDKRGLWPHEDQSVRFPQILADAGVQTVNFTGAHWILNRWGCVRGFTEEKHLKGTRSYYAHAEPIMDLALERMQGVEQGPIFLFIHFLDPHAPYDLSKVKGSAFDKYVGEIAMVDAQIQRFLDWLDASPLKDKTVVIIASDHGEAFGEHNSTTHATTLYEELLRVPLLIRGPGVAPRVVSEPISLVDLGPTILDLMGQPTPPAFMGQSLVPFLLGENPRLTRPILAEGRLKQSLVLRDGRKIIVDNKTSTTELYDLDADPGELHNLAGDEALLGEPLGRLRYFFDVHTIKRPGYKPPYRP